ncbi:T9SS type A sorting domain-containing protein, partial [bacterium]|nr:T9SS type A sorting domain-containing protein [bacterium]
LIYEKFPYAWLDETIDHWMWTSIDAAWNPEFSYILDVPGFVVVEDQDYDITLALRGLTYNQEIIPDHHVTVIWNDFEVISEYFTRQEEFQVTRSMDGIYANNAIPNELVFKADPVPGVYPNSFYIDWFEVKYWRDFSALNDTLLFRNPQTMGIGQVRYQITGMNESNPDSIELWNLTLMQRLRNFTLENGKVSFQDSAGTVTYYFIGSRNSWMTPEIVPEEATYWHTPNHSVDYLIITHEDFYDAVAELENLYEDRGMTVERVKVSDLYDEFSYGLKTPQAIFDFLQYAYYSYGPLIPGYILLVGDASWDYKSLDPLPFEDFVPTHSFMSERWGETSSDNWFAAVSANPYHLPDMYIGRLPANSEEEIDLMIDKIVDYSEPPPGYWQTQVILSNGADAADDDAVFMDSLVQNFVDNYFPDWYDPPRVYKVPSAGNEQFQGGNAEMLQYINEGAAMVNYIGHAGNQMWETLNLDTLQMIQNGTKTPFVAAFSCFTGIFSNTEGFGETFLKIPDGGAIGYWSNSSLGYQNNNGLINEHLMAMLFDDDTLAIQSLGALTTGAKWRYALGGAGNLGDVIEIFNLLGDPATVFVFDYPEPGDTVDTGPPQITFTGFGPNFHSGDFLDNPVDITITIADDNEILTAPGDFDVKLIWETNGQGVPVPPPDDLWPWDWSQDSLAYPDSINGHTIEIAFKDTLPDGEWRFEIYAEDVLNNESFESRSFKIATPLVLEDPLNWPNPFNQETNFTFTISQNADVTIKVYTVSGKLIWVYNSMQEAGYNIIPWDGRDRQGDPISNGTYIYKVRANNGTQDVEARQKLIRIR